MKAFIYILIFIASIFVIPALFMLIWNHVMPDLCNFNVITYWQSFWLGIGLRLINGTIGISRRIDKINNYD